MLHFKLQKRLIVILLAGILLAAFSTPIFSQEGGAPAAKKADPECTATCKRYLSCSADIFKKSNKKFGKKEKKDLNKECMKICGKHRNEILECNETTKNSCQDLFICIQKQYKSQKKK